MTSKTRKTIDFGTPERQVSPERSAFDDKNDLLEGGDKES